MGKVCAPHHPITTRQHTIATTIGVPVRQPWLRKAPNGSSRPQASALVGTLFATWAIFCVSNMAQLAGAAVPVSIEMVVTPTAP